MVVDTLVDEHTLNPNTNPDPDPNSNPNSNPNPNSNSTPNPYQGGDYEEPPVRGVAARMHEEPHAASLVAHEKASVT